MAAGRSETVTFDTMRPSLIERQGRIKAGAGAVGVLIALSFGDLSSELIRQAPKWLPAIFVTAIFLTGFFLAKAFIATRNALDNLERGNQTEYRGPIPSYMTAVRAKGKRGDRNDIAVEYHFSTFASRMSLGLLIACGVIYLVAIWVSVAA